MSSQMSEVLKRLARMIAEANVGLDATSKSLRGYTTVPHPVFVERLRQHYADLGPGRSKRGKTFTYEVDVNGGLTGSNVINAALQSFYDQEASPDTEVHILYPRVSNKTVLDEAEQDTLREEVEAWVTENSSLEKNMVSFRELVTQELGQRITTDLLENFPSSQLCLGVLQLLEGHHWTFPAHIPVTVHGRQNPIGGLTMKAKYYVSRDDNRAYCIDKNRLRALSGACLQRLIYLKDVEKRKNLSVSQVLRATDKDCLNLVVPRAHEGQVTLLILGDISNFTGSLANSWLLLLVVALDLYNSLRNKFSLFSIGGALLYATWFEVIAVYLYLTVGAECYVEDLRQFHHLPGGFLGVTANITTGLLCLSLIILDLTRRLLPRVYSIQSQAGGDDFAFLILVAKDEAEEVQRTIQHDMQKYVGQLKELKVFDVDTLAEGVIEDAYFCRKRVCLRRTQRHTVVGFEPSCPLPSSILPFDHITRMDLQARAWRELDLGLKAYEEECPHMGATCDVLREVFLRKYPRVQPTRVLGTVYWPPSGVEGRLVDGLLISKNAEEYVNSVPRVDIGPFYALVSFRSRLRHMQAQGLIQCKTLIYKGRLVSAYLVDEDLVKLKVKRVVERIRVEPDPMVLSRFLNILNS